MADMIQNLEAKWPNIILREISIQKNYVKNWMYLLNRSELGRSIQRGRKKTIEELKERGIQNGVPDMEIWDQEKLRKEEPNVSEKALAALYSPNVGIVSLGSLPLHWQKYQYKMVLNIN